MKTIFIYFCLLIMVVIISCKNNNSLESLFNKQLLLPKDVVFTTQGRDTISLNVDGLKIVYYIGQHQCFSCSLKKSTMGRFSSYVDSLFKKKIPILIYLNVNSISDANLLIERDQIDFPLGIDLNNSFISENGFPTPLPYNCFLLDSANRIILIGNPIQNTKIKELYIHTICEKLGIDYNPAQTLNNIFETNIGTITKIETKMSSFSIRNSESTDMVIDTLYSSCECTKAVIDKMVIPPSETATLSISYTPDGVGDFYREVYVQIKGEDKPLVYIIKGKVE